MTCSIKSAAKFLAGVAGIYAYVGHAQATPITIAITAQVGLVDDRSGFLGGSISVGQTVTGTYTYESTTPDTEAVPTVGDYWHRNAPFGITLRVGGLVFRTDPGNVEFIVEIVNDHRSEDNYLLRSYNNLFAITVPSDEFFPAMNHISWQLDDPTAAALSSDALPTGPPVLTDWQSNFGLQITSENTFGDFFVRAHVTSAAIIPEPGAWLLFCAGLSGILGYARWYGWRARKNLTSVDGKHNLLAGPVPEHSRQSDTRKLMLLRDKQR